MKDPKDLYLHYVAERESIQQRRESGAPFPWTNDRILQDFRFTNNRREDDRVTKALDRHHRKPHDGTEFDWVGVLLGRLTNEVAWFNSFSRAGAWPADRIEPDAIYEAIECCRAQGVALSAAYKIPHVYAWCERAKSFDKFRAIAYGMTASVADFAKRIDGIKSLRNMTENLQQVDGVGPFLAFQVAVDLSHMDRLRDAPDRESWALAGPGALKGLGYLSGGGVTRGVALPKMRELQQLVSVKLGIDLSLADIQNTCCEFSKYYRAVIGERPKRRYYLHPLLH